RYVAFSSNSTNLVAGDTNGRDDVFVHDTQTGVTTRVSVDSSGTEGDDNSTVPSISADGRYVAFSSRGTNLVAGDTNSVQDIFVHDTQTGATTRVSVDSSGVEGDSHSYNPSISADGRYVAFQSNATNLVVGDTNGAADIFVHDTQMGVTTRVSVDSSGVASDSYSSDPSISADGRYVAFWSNATNLVAGDMNGTADVFVHDTQTGNTTRVSVDSSGVASDSYSSDPSISADGRYVVFSSDATNLVAGDTNGTRDIFVHDTQTGVTTRVSVDSSDIGGDDFSQVPSISADGRYVAFQSSATNLVAGDTNGVADVFVHDTQTGVTTRFSVDSNDLESNNGSYNPSISADGRYVAFDSFATNLVADDTNGRRDVFSTATNFAAPSSSTENIPSTSVMGLLSLMTGVVAFGLIRRRKFIK
ncbi:TolB family protein, partial [Ostreibacterium oceani]|uniref:TolB family protein n=1 Tax=Ostreibacterium oceani TaxID=2654998 RepID=UPI00128CDD80